MQSSAQTPYLSYSILDVARQISMSNFVRNYFIVSLKINIFLFTRTFHLTWKSGGLPLNGIVCFNRSLIQEEYLKCPNATSPSAPVEAPVTIAPAAPESPVAPVTQSQATATSDGVRLPYAFMGMGTSALLALFAN
jgi:hypothetical protein